MTKRKVTDLLPTEAILISSDADLTLLGKLEQVCLGLIRTSPKNQKDFVYNEAIHDVLVLIAQLKPEELEQLKQAYCEGYIQTESAQEWVRKFGR